MDKAAKKVERNLNFFFIIRSGGERMKEQIEAVQRMQNYIAAHLYEQITLAELSGASLFSPWHSYRLFKKWTNLTPAEYIRRMRLSASALRLRDEGCRITDIAFEMGFGSVDGYQRAFYREFGCNPKEYMENPVPLYLFTPYGVIYREIRKEEQTMEHVKSVFVQPVEKPVRKVIIKRGVKAEDYFPYCEEVGCDVWGLLMSIKSLEGEPVCLWLPDAYRTPDTSVYVQGAEVSADYDGPVPDGFDVITLPASTYLMFKGEPFEEEDYCQAIEEVREAVNKYDPSAAGYDWDTDNPRIQLEPVGTRGYIELLPVRRK